jgi:hypothetical protein
MGTACDSCRFTRFLLHDAEAHTLPHLPIHDDRATLNTLHDEGPSAALCVLDVEQHLLATRDPKSGDDRDVHVSELFDHHVLHDADLTGHRSVQR